MSNTTQLATEAINTEGIDAYFPGLDLEPADAARILADYLDTYPGEWTAAHENGGWSFDGTTEDLVSFAQSSLK